MTSCESPDVAWTCHTPPSIHITIDCMPPVDSLRQQAELLRQQREASLSSSSAPTPPPSSSSTQAPRPAYDPAALGPHRDAPIAADAFDGTHVQAATDAIQGMCEAATLRMLAADPPPLAAAALQEHVAAATAEPPLGGATNTNTNRLAASAHAALVGTPVPPAEHVTQFHSVAYPDITLFDLACAVSSAFHVDAHTHLAALALMARAVARAASDDPRDAVGDDDELRRQVIHALRPCGGSSGMPTAHMLHRLFVACVHVVVKAHVDCPPWRTRDFARFNGIAARELAASEALVLRLCDWEVVVTAADVDALLERCASDRPQRVFVDEQALVSPVSSTVERAAAPTPGMDESSASPLETMLGGLVTHGDASAFVPHDDHMLSVSPAAYGSHHQSLSRDDLSMLMSGAHLSSASISALAT